MRILGLLALLVLGSVPLAAQQDPTGTLSGVVIDRERAAVVEAIIEVRPIGGGDPRVARTDNNGRFILTALPAGRYDVIVRRLGFATITLPAQRVDEGRVTEIRVELTASATELAQVSVTASNTQVDAKSPEQVERLEMRDIRRLATGRDIGSIVGLVPGSRIGGVWGGGGDLANNVQLDGVAAGHPGIGGDFLRPSIDWIERLEVRGLGAGADEGNFQGGIINAITRTGTDRRETTVRAYVEAAALSESNFNLAEEGQEQAGRREISGEALGPLVPGKLFYFVGGQAVARELRVPNLLTSNTAVGFRDIQTELRDLRGLAKLTWRPDAASRLDVILGANSSRTERAGLTGVDDPSSTQRVESPSVFYEVAWNWDRGTRHAFDLRLFGYAASETRRGYAGDTVPGVRAFALAREPGYQNADFNERADPSSISIKGTWTSRFATFGLAHRLKAGAELGGGTWRREQLRNAGMTWRPFPDPDSGFIDSADPATWAATGSQWGGEIRLRSEVRNIAAFLQDEIELGSRVTLSPGLRVGAWEGIVRASGGLDPRVSATGVDPRIGVAWDVLGDGSTALKAHWGRYHQGMAAALFDRLAGANVYSNERFYASGPRPPSPTTVYTPAERDSLFLDPTGAPIVPNTKRFDESGRADGYRQPYMDQLVLAAERSIGSRWKVELVYTERQNRNVVGLVDRNLQTNHTPIRDIAVRNRYGALVPDPNGELLTIPELWIPNNDLRDALTWMQERNMPAPPGFSYDTIPTLLWNPDNALTTLPNARRRFRQAYVALRTEQPSWSAAGSFAWTDLAGNIAGVTGTSGARDAFRAGGWVRPNEAINDFGPLDNFAELEAKMWLSARLPWGLEGGFTITHLTGELVTPFFEMEAYRYRFTTSHFMGSEYLPELLQGANGQQLFLESRGSRGYGDRTLVDLRVERRFALRNQSAIVTLELFNALGEAEPTAVHLRVDDDFLGSPSTAYAAVRRRPDPRRIRIGTRIEF